MRRVKDFFKKHNLIVLIIISLIFGLGGGLVGEITAQAYLADSWYGFSSFGNLDFSNGQYGDQGLVISNPKNVIVQQDAKVDETINSVSSSLVGIYKKQKPVKSNQLFILDNFYKINEPSGQGFIITSDGWIVTSLALAKNFNDYVVITKDKKIYQIDRAVADNLTKFNFIHVQARDLPVRKLAATQDIKPGSLIIGVNSLGANLVSSISGFSESGGLIKSSDSFSKQIILNDKLPAEFKGSIIFSLTGDALGLVNEGGEIEPISHLGGAVKSLFKNKTNTRPSLGINYVDLAELVEVASQNGDWQKGVIIYNDQKAAVKKNSPAEKSGLRAGDIIISIDGLELDQDNNLTDIVQDHLAGETVSLVILRQGEAKEVKITLVELK